ncbi:MAG TPA: sugar ABC transporter permease, partial [Clostridiales bacterium]|nr:sugar ABC transporter permease [Clostridiales bacterium]
MRTFYFLIQGTLPVAVPLMLVALGGMFSETSGVINIGLEGIMLFGSFVGCLVMYFLNDVGADPQMLLLMGMLIAAVAGAVFSMLLAFAAVNMKADQTIVGTAMNMLVPAIVLLYCKIKFNSDSVTTHVEPYITEVPYVSKIPVIGDLFFKDTYITIYIGALLLAIMTIVFYKTRFGLRLRACGEHPHAADSVGIHVSRMGMLT